MLDARPELKSTVVPRLGELHTTMAALRALGTSGIDDAWIEGDVFVPATTIQILKYTQYKRVLRAHIYSYASLYELVLEEFPQRAPAHERSSLADDGTRRNSVLGEGCKCESGVCQTS